MIVLAAATASYGLVIGYIVDQANLIASDESKAGLSRAREYAKIALPLLLGITLISGISNYISRIFANAAALHAVGDMQKQMIAKTHGADYASFAREPIGNLISKFTNDISVVSAALVRALSNVVKDLLTIAFVLVMMIWSNWQLTLMICVLYPLAAWPIITISKRLRGDAKNVQEHIGTITSQLKESLGGARMVRAYGLEGHETRRLNKSFDERIRRYLKLITEQARVDPILEVMGGLAIAGIVIFGVYQVSAGLASAGSIAAVLTWVLILSPRIRALGTLNNAVQEGLSALTRIFAVIDETPTIVDSRGARALTSPKGKIALENVSFTYADGAPALSGVSLTARPGETIALVGPSGGGKTTLMNLIPRLYDVTGGSVKIDDQDVRDLTLSSLRGAAALVSQDVTLFNDSIAANIGFGNQSAPHSEIIHAAKAADAHSFITALPSGYDTVLGEDGGTLSGGQRQRIAIARAILRDAPILLLDEATSALDTASEAKVQAALERLSKGRTSIIIAHRLSTVTKADRIYVIDKGRIIESGTHGQLLKKRGGLYAKLRKMQQA
jgi:subfamily B ATP-binding cassette protein MsbA